MSTRFVGGLGILELGDYRGLGARPAHRGPGSTPHRQHSEHTTRFSLAGYPDRTDIPDMSLDNRGPRAEVPESTRHTAPLAHTDRAPRRAARADDIQDWSTGATTSADVTAPRGR